MADFRITEVPYDVPQVQVKEHPGDWCHTCYKASFIKITYTARSAGIVLCWDCAGKLRGDLKEVMTY